MTIPTQVTALGFIQLVADMKLEDNFIHLIIPAIAAPATFFYMKQYMESALPLSLVEAARIDGSGEFRTFNSIVLPLMKPAIATVCIINFITCLNNLFTPLFYSNGIQVLSVSIVQLPLRDNMYGVPWDLVSAIGWIILLPIIIFVAVFEKQIMDGIMAGGVKA